jgi:hypothetical protein
MKDGEKIGVGENRWRKSVKIGVSSYFSGKYELTPIFDLVRRDSLQLLTSVRLFVWAGLQAESQQIRPAGELLPN